MSYINQVTIMGRLGRLPDMRSTPGGQKVANFSVAVTEKYEVRGEAKETTHWLRCVAWGWLADEMANAQVGDTVFVAGSLACRSWEKDGQKRESTEVKAFEVRVLPKRERRDGGGGGQYAKSAESQKSAIQAPSRPDDDIPF